MSGFSIETEAHEANSALAILRHAEPAAAQIVLEAVGHRTMARETELEPVDTGFMRNSTHLIAEPGEVAIVVGAEYAAAVNSNEDAVHPEGQAHFAEAALQEIAQNDLPRQIADELLPRMGMKRL